MISLDKQNSDGVICVKITDHPIPDELEEVMANILFQMNSKK